MNNILVTGGAGYIGSHAVRELMKKNHYVVVCDNLSEGHKEAVSANKFYNINVGNKDKIKKILKKHQIDTVMHFAGSAYVGESMKKPLKYYNNNVLVSLKLLEAMYEIGVKKIIFSSSCSIYGDSQNDKLFTENNLINPINVYARTKFFIEQIIQDLASFYGLNYVILRYFNVAGADIKGTLGEDHRPEVHLIPIILQSIINKRKVHIFGNNYATKDGTCIRDYVHVNDIVAAHIDALNYIIKSNGIFNIGTGHGYSNFEILKKIEEITNEHIDFDFLERRSGDPAILIADASLAKTKLKWAPKYSDLETIIQTAWHWFISHPRGYKF